MDLNFDDSKRLPLTDGDFISVIRLLGEVAGMDTSVNDRRHALLAGLNELIDGDVWMWVHSRFNGTDLSAFSVCTGGFASDQERASVFMVANREDVNRVMTAYWNPKIQHTFCASDLMATVNGADQAVFRQAFQDCGCCDTVFSLYALDAVTMSGIGLHRRQGKPLYSVRERTLAHLVLTQVDWLHRAQTDVPANNNSLLDLSPRQREVLLHLLGGDGRKQVARKMSLSEYTVDDHVQAIYRHFNVTSKSELLSLFIGGGVI